MSADVMELLRRADAAYLEAGDAVARTSREAENALSKEARIGSDRINAYETAFAGGIVIERVLDPESIRYHAGYNNYFYNLFEQGPDAPVGLELDEAHAASLEPAFAHSVWINHHKSLDRKNATEQPKIEVRFTVLGDHDNEDIDSYVDRPIGKTTDERKYTGPLEAIEWRLPTEADVLRFGGGLATQA